MKKQLLLMIFCAVAMSSSAQVFVENFETATTGGNLEGYNYWYVCLKAAEALGVSPTIAEGTLFYTDYIGSDIGKLVFLDSLVGKASDTQRISTRMVVRGADTLVSQDGQKMYAAFLVSILPNSYKSYRDFFTWEGSTTSSFTRGRVFARQIAGTSDIQFAVSKNSATAGIYVESPVISGGVSQNNLLVLEYDAIAGTNNDVISLYINPDLTKPQGEQIKISSTDAQSDYAKEKIKINLRQRGIGALVGGIRVGTSWDQVLFGTVGVKDVDNKDTGIYSYGKTIVTRGSGEVQVFDLTGRKIISKISNGRMETSLRNGLYIVRFKDERGKITSGKVCIKEQ
ncbi:MAG: T9SS type A sorting domain-containing protein [Bacteroidales bacterium]|jgi:hypothetical protein|nr:T9SS type A sorting domain-containing protein [Bacteroidales bacterium]